MNVTKLNAAITKLMNEAMDRADNRQVIAYRNVLELIAAQEKDEREFAEIHAMLQKIITG